MDSITVLEIAMKGTTEPIGFVVLTPKLQWLSTRTGDIISNKSLYSVLNTKVIGLGTPFEFSQVEIERSESFMKQNRTASTTPFSIYDLNTERTQSFREGYDLGKNGALCFQ